MSVSSRLLLGLTLPLALGSSCTARDDSGPVDGGASFWIHLELSSLGPDHVGLALTASSTFFETPLWRNGHLVGRFDLFPSVTTHVLDDEVSGGGSYTYIAGGTFLLGGEVWSEPLTVVVP